MFTSSNIGLQVLIFLVLLTSLELFGFLLPLWLMVLYFFFFQLGSSRFNDVKSLWKEDIILIQFYMTYGDLTILGTYASLRAITFLGTIFLFEGCCIICWFFEGYLFMLLQGFFIYNFGLLNHFISLFMIVLSLVRLIVVSSRITDILMCFFLMSISFEELWPFEFTDLSYFKTLNIQIYHASRLWTYKLIMLQAFLRFICHYNG